MATKLVSMKLDRKAREEMSKPTLVGDAPLYPWGLALTLDDEVLDKLGEDTLPDVGDSIMVLAKAKVTAVSSNESEGGKRRNISLQITDLCLEDPTDDTKTAAALYGKGKA